RQRLSPRGLPPSTHFPPARACAMRASLPVLAGMVATLAAGCSGGPDPDARAPYEPPGIAQAALEALEQKKNCSLERAELEACPALLHALPAIDLNRDRVLSRD